MDKVTIDALMDCLQNFLHHSARAADETEEHYAFQPRVSFEISSLPFLAALDFLQVPTGDGPTFDTVAAKWKHQTTARMEAIGKQLVTQYLVPVLLGAADMSVFSRCLVLFQRKPKTVRTREQSVDMEPELLKCAMASEQTHALVFASVQVRHLGSKGVKLYRIYDVGGCFGTCCGRHQELRRDSMLFEKEEEWEDTFDMEVAELFESDFKKMVFRDVLKASHRFAGLGIQFFDDANAILLTAPWAV